MRTLKYVIIGLAICSTFAFQSKDNSLVKVIRLTCLDKNASSKDLEQSADILQKRLEIFGIDELEIDIVGDKQQIVIKYYKDIDVRDLERILTPTGQLGFCSTLDVQEIESYIQNQVVRDILALGSPSENANSAIIGQVFENGRKRISGYLKSLEKNGTLPNNVKFAWSKKVNAEGLYSLYALQYEEESQALIKGKNLSEASWSHNEKLDNYTVSLAFDVQGRADLLEVSKANIGKTIAIVVDQEVYAAPRVVSEISGGQLQITGNFNQMDVAQLSAILGGGELPMKFRVD